MTQEEYRPILLETQGPLAGHIKAFPGINDLNRRKLSPLDSTPFSLSFQSSNPFLSLKEVYIREVLQESSLTLEQDFEFLFRIDSNSIQYRFQHVSIVNAINSVRRRVNKGEFVDFPWGSLSLFIDRGCSL